MAQFLMAKFLGQALEWKFRYPAAKFYAGLRYEPFLFKQARRTFPKYNGLYPNDDKKFTQGFVTDLRKKNRELIKQLNPDVITPEHERANRQFETEARLEQQQVAQINRQPPPQPFSFQARPIVPRIPLIPSVGKASIPVASPAAAPVSTASTTNILASAPVFTPATSAAPPVSLSSSAPPVPGSWSGQTSNTAFQPQKVNFRGLKFPNSFVNATKNLGSRAGVFFQRNAGKYLTVGRVATGVSTAIGAVTGGALTNGSAIGIFGGGGLGALAPSWIKNGGGANFLGKVGNKTINAGANISNQMSSGAAKFKGPSRKLALALMGAFFLLVIGASLLGGLSGTTPTQAAPITPAGNLSSCQFTRGSANPPAENYKSSTLLGYFQQAANTTGVPAAVLAAVARVESPSATGKTDADLPNLSSTAGCPRSPTGALGIMQVQPPGTTGYIQAAVNQGASYLGKTADQLTENDFCDLKSNITIAAGFILKKLQLLYNLGDGTKWDPSWTNNKNVIYNLAMGYYGCLQYGGSDPLKCTGPYNYGDDIWTSIQNCQAQTSPTAGANVSCPMPGGRISTPSYNANPSTGHCGNNYNYTCKCGTSGRRAKAIDVPTNGQSVVLPTISNQPVTWKLIVGPYPVDSGEGGGVGYTFRTTLGEDTYYLDMLHLSQSSLIRGGGYVSGTPIATTVIDHIHMTMGKNLTNSPVAGTETDCDPNWLPSDFMCQ